MMMVYGLFVFALDTLPYQQLRQSRNWRYAKNERVGRSAKWQYVGSGENQITLTGTLYPEITGGNLSLGAVATMAYAGLPWPLIDGVGTIYGMYVLTGLEETRQELDRYGNAKKIEFSITLQRVDEDVREKMQSASASDLLDTLKSGATTAFNKVSSVAGTLLS